MRLGVASLVVAITLVWSFTATDGNSEASNINLQLVDESSRFLRSMRYQDANGARTTGNNDTHQRVANDTSNQSTEERALEKVTSSVKNTAVLDKVESSVKKTSAVAKTKSVFPTLGLMTKFKNNPAFNKLTGFLGKKPTVAQAKAFVEKNPDVAKLKTVETSAKVTEKDAKRMKPLFSKAVGNNSLLWEFLMFVLTPAVFLAATIFIAVKGINSLKK
ncbi:hypothetical protein L917_19513 [Phytophthora nicotianae]|uniref:RxLR effector protein n=2 Tax=Phytophthora nicotianae TaxID=4792 RepID=W2FRJ5_PHYNI|nr:hypothetical protein L915_19776 [Phytophthora nicotianae]ETL26709.1 hypothetical protein L916_19661 [Phytophthora nicotianae]ETL79942.1 hypothetical protein L917_19513 [Phytophthora nicotianae]ETM33191.1 hypothetical protein L914_19547 [Phytophthora nicotianae]ETO61687.1 hypothetical protein F444_20340 [Phytophthora nicotianae P1976]